ncbi:MAG TPA: FtsX-like permease family protein [Mariprofundaceae bacterium]|nr:FtsX-like permease family protein [Mariprofundaceae bacterium]
MWALAWRNIVRNARRSLITVSAVALGLTSLIFLWGFNDGVHNNMMRNLQEAIVGSLQVHADKFFHHPKLNRTVPDPARVIALLQQQHIERYTSRLRTFALAAGLENSEGLVLLGMDPASEMRTTNIAGKVDRGRFIKSNDEKACVLGATTARNLGVKLGDEVVLLGEDHYGSLAAEKVKLVGIISSGEMGIDRGLAIVPLGFMQRMFDMGSDVSEVVVQLPEERLEAVTSALRQQLDGGYEVLRWYDMYPMMKQWVELENAFYYIFLSVVLVIVAAGIMNTVLMSMLDRIHEFGVMMALGCGRGHLAGMVVIESLLLGALGVAVGTFAGLMLVQYFHGAGIDLSGQMDTVARYYVDPVIHTEIDTSHLRNTILAVLAAAAIAALWPAIRAARLQPVEAIRHV